LLQISSGLIAISQANINSNNKLKENIRVLSKKAKKIAPEQSDAIQIYAN
jgi:hypothetical protein